MHAAIYMGMPYNQPSDICLDDLSRVCGGARVRVPSQEWMNLMLGNAKEVSSLIHKYGAAITKGTVPQSIIKAGAPK